MNINTSNIYNNLILSYVIFTFNKLDLFSQFESGIKFTDLMKHSDLEEDRLKAIIKVAKVMGIVTDISGKYLLTELGKDIKKNRGFFTWAIGGYSPLLEAMDTFLETPTKNWQPYVRGEYVAIGSDECNQELMQHIFDKKIDELKINCIADLGCGNAGRLVNLLKRKPELTGVGIDINPEAIKIAQKNSNKHNLTDRLQLVCENVFTSLTKSRPELKEVELVTSFMMIHDLFNIKTLQENLFSKMKKAFPKAKYFVFADTCLDEKERTAATMPIFTMGYELIHTLRGIQLFPLSYYKEQFIKEGLKLVAQENFGVPNTYLFILEI